MIIMRPNTSKSQGWPSVSVLVKLINFSFPCEMLLTAEQKKICIETKDSPLILRLIFSCKFKAFKDNCSFIFICKPGFVYMNSLI